MSVDFLISYDFASRSIRWPDMNGRSDGHEPPNSLPAGVHHAASSPRWLVILAGKPYLRTRGADDVAGAAALAEELLRELDAGLEEALAKLGGGFSAIIVDRRANRLVFAVDRFGQAPLYWVRTSSNIVHASNRACTLTHQVPAHGCDPNSVLLYCAFFVVPSPYSIRRSHHRLAPGTVHLVDQSTFTQRHVARLRYTDGAVDSLPEAHARVRTLLTRSVQRSLQDVDACRAGNFLSGGLDSSTIVGLTKGIIENPKTFTIRFREPKYDEGDYARLVATYFGSQHYEHYVTPAETVSAMDLIAQSTDEPYGNTSAVAAYMCATKAKAVGIECMLSGDGGDELFAGNERYLSTLKYDVYGRVPNLLRRWLIGPLACSNWLPNSPFTRKVRSLVKKYPMTLPMRANYDYFKHIQESLKVVFEPEFLAEIDPLLPHRYIENVCRDVDGGDRIQQFMAFDLKNTIADNDLVKVNTTCRMAGVDVVHPMLDDDLFDFCAQIGSSTLLPNGRLRGFFKDAFTGFLPDSVISKEKHGFGLPFHEWVTEDRMLLEKVSDALEALRRRRIFRDPYIGALQASAAGAADPVLRGNAWDAAMLELWFQSNPDAAP